MNITFRTDASNVIGTGHVVRCLTLAAKLRESGSRISFVCRSSPGNLIAEIKQQGFETFELSAGDNTSWLGTSLENEIAESERVMRTLQGMDWLVVDHYSLDTRWESRMRQYTKRIAAIDDIADRPHDCDLLLDQNYGANRELAYKKLVPNHARLLLGPHYALIRDSFLRMAEKPRTFRAANQCLVYFGGTDALGDTLKTLRAWRDLPVPNCVLNIIIGVNNAATSEIETLAQKTQGIGFVGKNANMAEMMAMADFFVGAGGTTTYERCLMGLPSIVIAIADNQIPASEELARTGCHLYLGVSAEVNERRIADAMHGLAGNHQLRESFSMKSRSLIDGRGAARVADCFAE